MNLKGRHLVAKGTKQRKDFSRVVGGKQSHYRINKKGEGGMVVVKRFANPIAISWGC
jgi:hypothetical protein